MKITLKYAKEEYSAKMSDDSVTTDAVRAFIKLLELVGYGKEGLKKGLMEVFEDMGDDDTD